MMHQVESRWSLRLLELCNLREPLTAGASPRDAAVERPFLRSTALPHLSAANSIAFCCRPVSLHVARFGCARQCVRQQASPLFSVAFVIADSTSNMALSLRRTTQGLARQLLPAACWGAQAAATEVQQILSGE